MSEAVRKTKTTRRKPAPKPEPGPSPEEIIAAEVERRVSAIIDLEAFDRQMLRHSTNVVSALCEARCTDHPFHGNVETAFNDALRAALERIERIVGNDRPPVYFCGKCGD